MDLKRLELNWNNLGRNDPLWAILAERPRADGSWDKAAFLKTGEYFVIRVHDHLRALGSLPAGKGRALDFGCGYGRLTQGMAAYFDEVVGVDIAASMVQGARELNAHGSKVQFVHNTEPDLRRFPDQSFDFILTILVLQHMRPHYALGYVKEFLRLLRPGGVAFFQAANLPSNPGPAVVRRRKGVEGGGRIAFGISLHPGEFALHADQWGWLRVRIANRGERLPARGPGMAQVGVRWQQPHGSAVGPVRLHDLPADLGPGDECDLLVPVRAPAVPASYLLACTVTENGAWIETLDRAPARLAVHAPPGPAGVKVSDTPPPPPLIGDGVSPAPVANEAIIEVHGTPVDEVLKVVRDAGCRVIEVSEDGWVGGEWLSAHYTVQKPR